MNKLLAEALRISVAGLEAAKAQARDTVIADSLTT